MFSVVSALYFNVVLYKIGGKFAMLSSRNYNNRIDSFNRFHLFHVKMGSFLSDKCFNA